MFHAGYQRFSKMVRLHYKSNTLHTVQNDKNTNVNESCVCEVGRNRKTISKLTVRRSAISIALLTQHCSGDQHDKMGGTCSMYAGKKEVYTGFWWGNLRERDHLEDPVIDGRIILRWIFRRWDVRAWTGSSWLRIRTGSGYL